MRHKHGKWLIPMVAGLLLLGLSTGCEKSTTDDNSGTNPSTTEIPSEMRGTWFLHSAQAEGQDPVIDVSGARVELFITSVGGSYIMFRNFDVDHEGDVSWEERDSGDFLVLDSNDGSLHIEVEILAYTATACQAWVPVEEGGHELWVMAKGGGTIAGVVNNTGDYLPQAGVTVQVIDPTSDEVVGSTITTDMGIYEFTGMTEGFTYIVEASKDGYETMQATVETEFGDPAIASFTMHEPVADAGTVAGRITDSQNGDPIQGVTITSSPSGGTATTDVDGYYSMQLGAGDYTLTASLSGYYDNSEDATVTTNDLTTVNFVLSPELVSGEGDMRFVLSWNDSPSDLDSHLKTPPIDGTEYHVYFGNTGNQNDAPYATLDNDEVSGYGPETITIYQQVDGTYRYYVYNFSATEADLAGCGAQVAIYDQNGLMSTITIPETGEGRYWYVCDVDGSTGEVTAVNQIQDGSPDLDAGPITEKAVF